MTSAQTQRTTRLLPDLTHLGRVPVDIGAEQIAQIRKAAVHLPHAIKTTDAASREELDAARFVMLTPDIDENRPGRWIAPNLMRKALEFLDSEGVVGKVKAVAAERTAQLAQMGLRRDLSGWHRHSHHTLETVHGSFQTLYRVRVEASLVWDFIATGEKSALSRSLREPAPCGHATEVDTFLLALVDDAQRKYPSHLGMLIPALQSETAKCEDLVALRVGCAKAVQRWESRVREMSALADLTSELAFHGYPDSFHAARRLRRRVTLFVGPPNSGKTHQAFELLTKAESGAYLAPLRLLALEGRDRLQARGVPCSLLTGEENDPAEGARVVSSTVEMVNTREVLDVAVIDEAQMIFDHYRGWAWTQALVGVPARHVVVICSAFAAPAIRSLFGVCGESCEVQEFVRKQHVQPLDAPVSLKQLRKGDAVVAFSRRDVLMLRDKIAQDGKRVSVIYGALPPEVRRREADRFAQEEADILVATDAIGMGLNLPIRRVLFSTMEKYDGIDDRTLNESEVHQIAGRAGRFGLHEEGFAGVLREAEPKAGRALSMLLQKQPQAPRDFKARVAPNWWHVDTIAARMGESRLHSVLTVFMEQLKLDSAHFEVAELEQMMELAAQLDGIATRLPIRDRFIYAQAPVDTRAEYHVEHYLGWARSHARTGQAGTPTFGHSVDEFSRLDHMEQALRLCTLWLWLDMRFPGVYGHVRVVKELRQELNGGIERQLKSKRPLWELRRASR